MGKSQNGKELGEGISQRKDGRYCARFTDRYGKRVCIYSEKLSELKQKLDDKKFENRSTGGITAPNVTVDKWFQEWLSVYKKGLIRVSTSTGYINVYNKHIKPVLGNARLSNVNQKMIQELINNLEDNGLKYATTSRCKIMLQDMFDKAMTNGYVLKNPVRGVRVKHDTQEDRRVLTKEEELDFFRCSAGMFYDNLFKVAINTGLRIGELCALTWNDIDLKNKYISVTKTLLYQKIGDDTEKTFHINPPKTKTSIRHVPINDACMDALKSQWIQRNAITNKLTYKPLEGFKDLLFTTRYGTPLCDQIVCDSIRRVTDEINASRADIEEIEPFSSHAFRHTFATRCFTNNIPPKVVQKWLGHATLQMTMDLYTHVLSDDEKDYIALTNVQQEERERELAQLADERYNNALKDNNKVKTFGRKAKAE